MREAVVLAGGLGTRLRSVVPDLPKAMAPVAGRPFLEWLLQLLESRGFDRVVLALGHGAEAIRAYFGDRWGRLDLVYSIEAQPLGTGGAIRAALLHCHADPVHALNGDTWLEPDVADLERLWQRHHELVIVAQHVADTSRYGRLELAPDGHIRAFGEKTAAGPGLINAGWYLLSRDTLRDRPAGCAFSFERDFLAPAVQAGHVRAAIARGPFIDIGVPDDYARAQRLLAAGTPREAC